MDDLQHIQRSKQVLAILSLFTWLTKKSGDGELYNYYMNVTTREYKVFAVNNKGVGRILATITDAPPAYIHSIFSTKNYVILVVWQADLDTNKDFFNLLDTFLPWDPKREALFCK